MTKKIISLDQSDHPAKCSAVVHQRASTDGAQTLEIARQCQCQRDSVQIQLPVNGPPGGHQHNCLGGVTTRGLNNAIDILSLVYPIGRVIFIVLRSDLEPSGAQDGLYLLRYSAGRQPPRQFNPTFPGLLLSAQEWYILGLCFAVLSYPLTTILQQPLEFSLVSPEDVLLAPSEIRMNLSRQERIFRDISLARVLVQRQQEKGHDADDDAEERDVGR